MSEPLPPMYLVDAEMPSQVGPVAALMYSILMAHEVDGITQMSHKRLTEITGISHSTVKRNLDKLYEAGLLKSESQHLGKGGVANAYLAPTTQVKMTYPLGQNDLPLGFPYIGEEETRVIQKKITTTEKLNTTEKSRVSSLLEDNLSLPSGRLRRPEGEDSFPTEVGDVVDTLGDILRSPGTYPATLPPVATRNSGSFPNLLDQCEQALWLVDYFHVPVLAEMNQARQARGWKSQDSVGEKRLTKWFTSAIALVADHSLDDVVRVIDWVFAECGGVIPKSVVEDDRQTTQDRKLTRLDHIVKYWGALVEEMTIGSMSLMEVLQAKQNREAVAK
jgi:DNA-binding transcriptional ArsR family regulator